MQLWVADEERGLMRAEDGVCRQAGPPGAALCAGWGRVFCAGQRRCVCVDRQSGDMLFDVAVPTGVCAMAVIGEAVCALSADADSVTAFSVQTGELLFSAPAGAYPRDLCPSPQGRLLAVAGGAAGSVTLLDGSLRLLREYRLPGAVCGVCFPPRCLLALCAVEREDAVASRLLRLSARGARKEIAASPLAPACLCALPDGGCVMGCMGEAVLFSPRQQAVLRRPFPCPARIRPSARGPLICDPCRGGVFLLSGEALYRGKSPQDALLL